MSTGRQMLAAGLLSAAALALTLAPSAAHAGCQCLDWNVLPQPIDLCVKIGAGATCDGSALAPAPTDAVNNWNAFLGHWTVTRPAVDVAAPRDHINSVERHARITIQQRWGVAIPGQVLGITFIPVTIPPGPPSTCPPIGFYSCQYADPGQGLDVDVIAVAEQPFTLDEEQAVTTYNTPGVKYALRQILIHEIGHAMGLLHEQNFPAIMNPTYLPYRNVTMLGDDVGVMRLKYPNLSTHVSDPAVTGFTFAPGIGYMGSTVGPARVNAGTGSVNLNAFTLVNRSEGALPPTSIHIKFNNTLVGDVPCPEIAANNGCGVGNGISIPIPWDLSGHQIVYAEIDPLPGEALPADDRVKLGEFDVTAAAAVDQDHDGVLPGQGDCNDLDPNIHPGMAEVCDGIDQDCDRLVDEGAAAGAPLTRPCYGGPAGTAAVGLCRAGVQTCASAQWVGQCVGEVRPQAGFCDGVDHNCDGVPDTCQPLDAAIVDARIVDAFIPPPVDARIVDAFVPPPVDARVIDAFVPPPVDAQIVDALVPPPVDARVLDAAGPPRDAALPRADAQVIDAAWFDDAATDAQWDAATDAATDAMLLDAWVISVDAGIEPPPPPLPDAFIGPPLRDASIGPPPTDAFVGPPPPADAAVNPTDGKAPGTDGAVATADMAAPGVDGAHPATDGAVTATDGASSQPPPPGPDAAGTHPPGGQPDAAMADASHIVKPGGNPLAQGNGCACRQGAGPSGVTPALLAPLALLALRRRRR